MRNGSSASGGDVFPFQTPKRSNRMAERGMYCVSCSVSFTYIGTSIHLYDLLSHGLL